MDLTNTDLGWRRADLRPERSCLRKGCRAHPQHDPAEAAARAARRWPGRRAGCCWCRRRPAPADGDDDPTRQPSPSSGQGWRYAWRGQPPASLARPRLALLLLQSLQVLLLWAAAAAGGGCSTARLLLEVELAEPGLSWVLLRSLTQVLSPPMIATLLQPPAMLLPVRPDGSHGPRAPAALPGQRQPRPSIWVLEGVLLLPLSPSAGAGRPPAASRWQMPSRHGRRRPRWPQPCSSAAKPDTRRGRFFVGVGCWRGCSLLAATAKTARGSPLHHNLASSRCFTRGSTAAGATKLDRK